MGIPWRCQAVSCVSSETWLSAGLGILLCFFISGMELACLDVFPKE